MVPVVPGRFTRMNAEAEDDYHRESPESAASYGQPPVASPSPSVFNIDYVGSVDDNCEVNVDDGGAIAPGLSKQVRSESNGYRRLYLKTD